MKRRKQKKRVTSRESTTTAVAALIITIEKLGAVPNKTNNQRSDQTTTKKYFGFYSTSFQASLIFFTIVLVVDVVSIVFESNDSNHNHISYFPVIHLSACILPDTLPVILVITHISSCILFSLSTSLSSI